MFRRLLLIAICALSGVPAALAAGRAFTLVIDAGHGGNDAGALGHYSKEKNINLNVALAFGRYVERGCPDVRVVYTRKADTFVPLYTRANIANKAKADLFISIHTNALPKGATARGMETYTLGMHRTQDNLAVAKRENSVILEESDYKQRYEGFDPRSSESYIIFELMQDRNMAKSVELAKMVQRNTCAAAGRKNNGVKQAGFLVIRETSMPSCLIELGFITTPDEEAFLNTDNGIDRLAYGIYQAFVEYRRKNDKGFTGPIRIDAPKAEQPAKAEPPSTPTTPSTPNPPATPSATNTAQPPVSPANPVSPTDQPVFKVQITTSPTKLRANSPQLKGIDSTDCYKDGGVWKYTVGASADYARIAALRRTLLDKFPDAFVIAFRGDERTDVQEALRQWRKNKQK